MSLAEMLVAVSLSAVVLLTGTALLLRLLHQASDEVGRPPVLGGPDQLALLQMERDAQRAVDAPQRRGDWRAEQGTILFEMPDGEVVVYHRESDVLMRTVIGEPHEPERVRRLVDELIGADFARREKVFHLRLTRSGHDPRYRVVLGRNLGRHAPPEGGR
jgi:hypothetical protein